MDKLSGIRVAEFSISSLHLFILLNLLSVRKGDEWDKYPLNFGGKGGRHSQQIMVHATLTYMRTSWVKSRC